MFGWIDSTAKTVTSAITGFSVIAGGYYATDLPRPISHWEARRIEEATKKMIDERFAEMKPFKEQQYKQSFSINNLRFERAREELLNRKENLPKITDPGHRRDVENRIRELDDTIEDIKREDAQLRRDVSK